VTAGRVCVKLSVRTVIESREVPLRVMLALSAADKDALLQTEKKNPDWRVRERAWSVLLLAQGKTCAQVAELQELTMRTVSNTRKRWLAAGLGGLADLPRSGAPAKVSPSEIERLAQWVREEPLSLTELKARHEEAGGAVVHLNTLKAVLKAGGFVWKRTRHSLKKNETTRHLNKQNKRLST
jgi:transposase